MLLFDSYFDFISVYFMILRSIAFSGSDLPALYVSALLIFVCVPWRQHQPTYLQIKKPRLDKLLSLQNIVSAACFCTHFDKSQPGAWPETCTTTCPHKTCNLSSAKTSPQIPLHTAGPVPPHTMPCAGLKPRALCEPRVPEPLARQTPRYTYRCTVRHVRQGWGQNGCGPSAPTRRLRDGGQK